MRSVEQSDSKGNVMMRTASIMGKEHDKVRDEFRRQITKKDRKNWKMELFENFMDPLSQKLVIQPILKYDTLTQEEKECVFIDLQQFSGSLAFNKKLLNLEFDIKLASIFINSENVDVKSSIALALLNLAYFCSQNSVSRMIQFQIAPFLLAQIQSINFCNRNQRYYLERLAVLIRNITSLSDPRCNFGSYLLDQSYFTLLFKKISQFSDEEVGTVKAVLHTAVKTMKTIFHRKLDHPNLFQQCSLILGLNQSLNQNLTVLDSCQLYIYLFKKIPQDARDEFNFCCAFQNFLTLTSRSFGSFFSDDNKIIVIQAALTFIENTKSQVNCFVNGIFPLVADCIRYGSNDVKMVALKLFASMFLKFDQIVTQDSTLIEEIGKILKQSLTVNNINLDTLICLVKALTFAFRWKSANEMIIEKDIVGILCGIFREYQQLQISDTISIMGLFYSLLNQGRMSNQNTMKTYMDKFELSDIIRDLEISQHEKVREAAFKLKRMYQSCQ